MMWRDASHERTRKPSAGSNEPPPEHPPAGQGEELSRLGRPDQAPRGCLHEPLQGRPLRRPRGRAESGPEAARRAGGPPPSAEPDQAAFQAQHDWGGGSRGDREAAQRADSPLLLRELAGARRTSKDADLLGGAVRRGSRVGAGGASPPRGGPPDPERVAWRSARGCWEAARRVGVAIPVEGREPYATELTRMPQDERSRPRTTWRSSPFASLTAIALPRSQTPSLTTTTTSGPAPPASQLGRAAPWWRAGGPSRAERRQRGVTAAASKEIAAGATLVRA